MGHCKRDSPTKTLRPNSVPSRVMTFVDPHVELLISPSSAVIPHSSLDTGFKMLIPHFPWLFACTRIFLPGLTQRAILPLARSVHGRCLLHSQTYLPLTLSLSRIEMAMKAWVCKHAHFGCGGRVQLSVHTPLLSPGDHSLGRTKKKRTIPTLWDLNGI